MSDSALSSRTSLLVTQMPRREKDDGKAVIRRLMIANRGEIACRIIATCRKLQITTVVIYVDEDSTSRHISDADEAIHLGSVNQPDGNPFLNIGLLVEVASRAGVDAVHPGYGYLSENVQFADAVRAAGIIYVGPGSEAISTLGDKRQAKEYLSTHEPSVPLVPGFTGSSHGIQLSDLEEQSAKIGFPVMIKAAAGGGGRGMRIVYNSSSLPKEFERAQSEAQRSFGSSDCILEKYVEASKHVEVQIIGDQHGKVMSFWERECSIQRRHQKIIEETPCRWLTQEEREKMCATAVRIGELLQYEGAGTVEFIVDVKTRAFYFLEVNARLQVEHPITEECTGLDLVSLQLFVASGGSLASLPYLDTIPQRGHAIECRLCAEDPNREFAPQHGLIRLWEPWEQEDVRFETAIVSGARISIYFDSMIAKLVVWAPNRSTAIEKMVKILANTPCVGVSTNQLFLQACLLHLDFRDIGYSTSFIPKNINQLLRNPHSKGAPPQNLLMLVPALFLHNTRISEGRGRHQLFGSIRRGFRNQSFDPVNVSSNVVASFDAVQGKDIDPHVILWTGSSTQSPDNILAKIAPLPQVDDEREQETQNDDASAIVTKAYNTLSSSIRKGTLSGSSDVAIKIQHVKSRVLTNSPQSSWRVGSVDVTVGGQRLTAYIGTGELQSRPIEPDMGDSVHVFCHFPRLGSYFEYRCFSILSFFEKSRLAEAEAGGADSKTIKATMPCKVLKVLKKQGDEVKTGEVVVVVESMKMEITVSASADGTIESVVKEGDAVNEGATLCKLS